MATQNSINVPTGTTGQLLVGVTSAAPAFGSSASGDFTFTTSTASTTRTLTTSNTDNTSGTSHANIQVTTGGASSGDPVVTHTVTGATSFTTGIDNSSSDSYKIAASTALGTTDTFIMTTGGNRTMPLHSSFFASLSSDTSNDKTGDGTLYTIICNTEAYDQNSNYNNSTGVFTAPVTGRYRFTGSAVVHNLGAGHTLSALKISASSYVADGWYGSPVNVSNGTNFGMLISAEINMTAADTASLVVQVTGSTKTIGVVASQLTRFSGFLVC